MNEELKNQINEFMSKLIENVEKGGDVLAQEFPHYIEQLLMWHTVMSLSWFTIGVVLVIGSVVLSGCVKRIRNKAKNDYSSGEKWTRHIEGFSITSIRYDLIYHGSIIIPPVSIIVGIVMIVSSLDWLQIMIAPNVWLVEYARSMI